MTRKFKFNKPQTLDAFRRVSECYCGDKDIFTLSSFYQLTIWVVTLKVFDKPFSLFWRCSVSFVNVNVSTPNIDSGETLIFIFSPIFSLLFYLKSQSLFHSGFQMLLFLLIFEDFILT